MNLSFHNKRLEANKRLEGRQKVKRYFPYRGLTNTKNKDGRIQSIEGAYTSGKIRFRRDWRKAPNNYALGLRQVWNYTTSAEFKDGPDVLEMLHRCIFSGGLNVGGHN